MTTPRINVISFSDRSWRLKSSVLMLGLAMMVCVCACDPGVPFELAFETEHFRYYVQEGQEPPCAGKATWLERHFDSMSRFLDVDLPPGKRIDYYLYTDKTSLKADGCPAHGCTQGRTIRTVWPIYAHELVHAIAFESGEPPLLFQEGLAEVLGCSPQHDGYGRIYADYDLESLITSGAFRSYIFDHGFGVYAAAASFTRYLMDRFGVKQFLGLYATLPYDATRNQIKQEFQERFGVAFSQTVSAWQSTQQPFPDEVCLHETACMGPAAPLNETLLLESSCGPFSLGGVEAIVKFGRSTVLLENRLFMLTTSGHDEASEVNAQWKAA